MKKIVLVIAALSFNFVLNAQDIQTYKKDIKRGKIEFFSGLAGIGLGTFIIASANRYDHAHPHPGTLYKSTRLTYAGAFGGTLIILSYTVSVSSLYQIILSSKKIKHAKTS